MATQRLKYNTKTFSELFEDFNTFKAEFYDSPFHENNDFTERNLQINYYLLYNKYGNSPIANMDEYQFKSKLFGIIWQFGPVWQEKLKIQAKLRSLGLESTSEIFKGNKLIHNRALNPEISPSVDSDTALTYINEQTAQVAKKSILDGLQFYHEMLEDSFTTVYIDRFKPLFKEVVMREIFRPYVTEDEDDEE